MHDIWNPWHGCIKCSEGCQNCYMYFLDKSRDQDGSKIYKTKNGFDYPVQLDKNKQYKVKSGELIRICMSSDFFLEEADKWRDKAWDIIHMRPDVKFYILTKRPQRVEKCLPKDWGDGWDNIIFNVTCENQKRADERIPILLALPFKHKGIMAAPLIDEVSVEKYLEYGQIEQVLCSGENYDGCRPCRYEWVKKLSDECKKFNITFCFTHTGTVFVKDGKTYNMPKSDVQREQAYKSNLNYCGRPVSFKLKDSLGYEITEKDILYKPQFISESCKKCSMRITCLCNGCSDCGKCKAV